MTSAQIKKSLTELEEIFPKSRPVWIFGRTYQDDDTGKYIVSYQQFENGQKEEHTETFDTEEQAAAYMANLDKKYPADDNLVLFAVYK